MKRRYVPIAAAMLSGPIGLLRHGSTHPRRIVQNGLPLNARLVGADVDPVNDVVRIWFEHESFEDDDPDELMVMLRDFQA